MNYRFRTGDKGELVLQVGRMPIGPHYTMSPKLVWEDATVHDIPVTDPFRPQEQDGPGPNNWTD